MGKNFQPMVAHQKIASAQPIPWFSFQKFSAHGLGWAGLGRAGRGLAQPIRSSATHEGTSPGVPHRLQ